MNSHDAYFFGYGSLVNRNTHHFADAHRAQLRGWRRAWRHTSLREVAYLTVVPDEASVIDGLIAAVPADDWAALDEREGAYDRVKASHQVIHELDHAPEIAVYSVPDGLHRAPDEKGPVLLSYIDVVVQGYLAEYGEEGVVRFFETTDGWDAPILNDRAAPRYPRHQSADADLRDLADQHLRKVGASIRPVS
ncbi:gamma-glutamylcyclotransferase [Roseovarius sp. SCSIO 43702]|uniref:gamma-glutamylcyclotransferase family protein n=1 Tax=Roseovarius sp. SCSIO 43702 TaxID=2823043 RepID=UPI001C72C4EF|nr:gamma-glutamylcyclotransferase family protein [Roseovarius sp. SCSIO 43702]QYX57122.1 gamma-glutamylcyclotransferase [Roseovarius sp. SCSIO 43702]